MLAVGLLSAWTRRRRIARRPVASGGGGLARMWRAPRRHLAHPVSVYWNAIGAARRRTTTTSQPLALWLVAIAIVYWDVLTSLVRAWYTDDNYSHGFFIVPLAAVLRVGASRAHSRRTPIKPSAFGLVVVAGSLFLLVGGILGAELFLSRVSFLGVLDGHDPFPVRLAAASRADLSAGVPAADDSDAGDHLQPDRVSRCSCSRRTSANTRSARSTFQFFAKATS